MKKIIPVNCVNVFAQITQQATSYSKVLKQHLLLVCLLFMFENAFSQNADLTTIYDRLHSQRSADKFVKDSVVAWQNRLANNGRWPDVNYTITNSVPKAYSPIVHLDRIYAMVLAYTNASATNTLYHNAALLAKIKLALADNLGRKHDAVFGWNNDWYATYIVNPGSYAKSLLMLKGEIPQNELLIYSAQLRDGLKVKNSGGILQFESGGQNLIWVANVTIYKGLIENNSQKVDSAFYYISSTLSYITNSAGEGIKRDGAFHQHGKQVYSAGYGLWFTSDVIYYIELSQNTSYNNNFTAEKKAIFSNLLLNGHQWLSYRSVMDYGAEGRNISRMGSYSVSAIGAWLLDKMAVFDAGNAAKYQSWKINRNGGVSSLTGNKHFWQSDLMVHRGANFFLSTKVPSVRTNGTETMNTENLKGFYLAVGAMNILSSGNEYKDIFPVWDWSRVPGTTAEQSVTYPSAHIFLANNNFAGAVSSGSNGTIAFKATYNGIANNKAYFYMGGSVYCMGAGISATKQNAVLTSINQTLSNGTITLNNGSVGVFTNGATSYNNLQWAHHDNVGYVFPKVGNVTVKNDVQKGAWYDINNLYSTAAHKAIQSKNVFSIWMDHGKTPKNASYHYIVVPSVTVDELTKFSANHGFLIAQNDTNIQAVENSNLKIWSAVFYRAGKVQFSNGLTLQADKAAVVMLEFSSGVYTLSVADPLQNSDQINISINSYLTGPNATYLNGNSTIKIVMPKGEYIGSTVKNNYNTDLIAPTVPTLLKASNTKSVTTELSWTSSSDNVAVVSYEIYQDAVLIGTSSINTFSVTGLAPSSTYSFSVKAKDAANNVSASSAALAVTTTSACGNPVPWRNNSFADQYDVFTAEMDVQPSYLAMDGVVGLSDGSAAAFTQLAVILQFNTDGYIKARNGATYTYQNALKYEAGKIYHVLFEVNIISHTYNLTVTPQNGTAVVIALNYLFRTEQSQVLQLNNVAYTSTICELEMNNFSAQNVVVTKVQLSPEGENEFKVKTIPNCFSTNTTVQVNDQHLIDEIIVYDVNGVEVKKYTNINGEQFVIGDVLMEGMYFFKVRGNGGEMVVKVIKVAY